MRTSTDDIDRLWAVSDGALESRAAALIGVVTNGSGALQAALVCPVPDAVPRRTPVRHLDCSAVLRCANGTLWGLRSKGGPWSAAQLATAAAALEAVAVGTPADEAALRVGFALDLMVSIRDPLSEASDAFWEPRRTASMVLLGLPRPAEITDAALGQLMARQHLQLERGLRSGLRCGWQQFCAALDPEALALAGSAGASAYNFLVGGTVLQQRARRDLARTFPVFLPCAISDAPPAIGSTVRQAAETGVPLVRTLARQLRVRPVAIRALVGVSLELAGRPWASRPRALLTLLDALRAEDLPRQGDAAAWAGFNCAVAFAERLFRRAPWTSTLALSWLREAARGRWRSLEPAANETALVPSRAAMVDAFRDAAAVALQAMIEDGGAPGERAPAATLAVLDRHLAALAPTALLRLADRFERALADARIELAEETGRLAGELFASLLPQDHLSSNGARRVTALSTRGALQAHGRDLDICLASSHAAHYAAQCADGNAFLLGIYDTGTGAPCATAELRAQRDRATHRFRIEVRQFSGRRNADPSPQCQAALDEVLAATQTPAMQEHIARSCRSVAERRRLGKDGAARQARLRPLARALRSAVGERVIGNLVAEALASSSGTEGARPC